MARPTGMTDVSRKRPLGLRWRSSTWFITLVVGTGIATDLGIYSMIIPVIPYRLEALGYTQISSKTSYLLLAYSLSLVLSTLPIVWASERFSWSRKAPLLGGMSALAASLVMFMLAPNYAVFVIARVLQGISGSVIWVVGLALLCDIVPEENVGQQLGLALTGVTVGFSMGPPIGGALYQKLGFHAPFIFCLGMNAVDFIARLLIIERKDAARWADQNTWTDPCDHNASHNQVVTRSRPGEPIEEKTDEPAQHPTSAVNDEGSASPSEVKKVSQLRAVCILLKSPRAIAALVNTFIFGVIITSQEPTITLRLFAVWGLPSLKVGLIYLVAAVPTLFSGAIVGHIADRHGPEWISPTCLLLALPWFMLLIFKKYLALFIFAFAASTFFLNGTIAPCTSELAATVRSNPAVTYGHAFGAFNMAYSLASSVGPVIAGQIYDHVKNGWLVLCILDTVLVVFATAVSVAFVGNRPLLQRILGQKRPNNGQNESEVTKPPVDGV